MLREITLQTDHDASCLLGISSRADLEIDDRPRHAQVIKEDLGHRFVVVLARVNDFVLDTRSAECYVNGSGLYEIRPRAHDGDNHSLMP